MLNPPTFPLSNFRFGSYTQIGKDQQKKLAQIVNNIIDIPEATDFLHPVAWRELQLDDYLQVIKHPMNLYKVQQKMKAREYNTVQQVLDHIQLVWDNCKEYNKEGHYFQLAEKMEKMFKKMIKNYLPSVQYTYQPKPVTIPTPQQQQNSTRKMTPQSQLHPSMNAARTTAAKVVQKQTLQEKQAQVVVAYQQESNSEMHQSEDEEPLPPQQQQQIPLTQKSKFHQRLKQLTQQQLAQIVTMIQQHCSEGFKHVSGNRYQILVDKIDLDSFRKVMNKVEDLVEAGDISSKANGVTLGTKKVKV